MKFLKVLQHVSDHRGFIISATSNGGQGKLIYLNCIYILYIVH